MDGDYEILKYTHDKHPESHIHEYYEIFLSLSNDGKFFVKETGYSLHLGTAFFLSPLEIHRCFCHENRDYDRYIIHFTEDKLKELSTEKTDLLQLFSRTALVHQIPDEILGKLLGRLSTLIKPESDVYGYDIERKLIFERFLLDMARVLQKSTDEQLPKTENEKVVNAVLQYIHRNYSRELSMEELTKEFFVSKSWLSQMFRETTGFSVGDYIITYRIRRACELLKTGMSVKETGEKVGFAGTAHFIRMFKKKTGTSPGRFTRGENGD